MSVKQIIINSDASTTASAVVSGANRTPTNFPELVFGDSYSIIVKFTGNSEDGFVAPDSSAQYLFNIGALSRATGGTFEISYDGEYTDVLPFNASADMIATALNSLPKIVSAGGVNVSGTDGSPYRIIFKQNGSRKDFEIRSNLFPDTNPIVHIVNSGDDNSCCEILIVLKLDTIASVSNYIVNQSAKELRFDVSLNTVECLLALGTSDKVRLLAELKCIDSNGNVFTYSQSQCTIHNRLIDVNTLEYATIEITGVLESVKAIEKKMADLYSPYAIERKGELWFNRGILTCANKWITDSAFSLAFTFAMTQDDWTSMSAISNGKWIGTTNYGQATGVSLFNVSGKLHLILTCEGITGVSIYKNAIRISDWANYLDGKSHCVVASFGNGSLAINIDGIEKGRLAIADFVPDVSQLPLSIRHYGQMSRIKYFNFDMSSANAPYTIADYIAGKDESPLLSGTLLSLEDYTFNGKVFDVSGNNNTATITGAVYGSKDNAVEQMYQAFSSRIGNLTE